MTRIAIIGAGLAGLTLARELKDQADITVFEKSAGAGGRMATRRAPPFSFDHGAQFFTAKSAVFQKRAAEWVEVGLVRSWNIRFAELERDTVVSARNWDDDNPHFVGAPTMSEIGKHLAHGIDVRLNTPVAALTRAGQAWVLARTDGQELGMFDWVISTAPAPQTSRLLPQFQATSEVKTARMVGCCALMLGFAQEAMPHTVWQAALVREADISWISVNSSKPGRGDGFSLVVHSTNAYAETNLSADDIAIQTHLLDELRAVTGIDPQAASHIGLHRWRYANIPAQEGRRALLDKTQNLGACGDWLIHGRIEAAFLSAIELATSMRQLL